MVALTGTVASAAEPSCSAQVGPERAALYVKRCLLVSPATHPPCNADNPCALILDEVARGCALVARDADRVTSALCAGSGQPKGP